ncbi:MAG: TonB-dependent receptor plug domain-containing protein [Novosphingobium sp.]
MFHRPALHTLLFGATALSALVFGVIPAQAAMSRSVQFDIPAGNLASALNEVGRQSGVRVAFPYDRASARRVAALQGMMTAEQAVRLLIANTGLKIASVASDHILLTADGQQSAAEQDAQASESPKENEKIVVTGYRLANRRALASKKNSDQVIDAVSQDEVSQLPDVNIVEAARRIPGLSVISDRDSSRGHDNYQYVTIRGLDSRYNLVTVDGAQIASADSTDRCGSGIDVRSGAGAGRLDLSGWQGGSRFRG